MDIQKAFNKHFIEFIDDVASYFHDRIEIQTTANALRAIRKANPKLIITVWKSSVVDKYIDEIEKGDLSFFISKEYSSDVKNMENNKDVLNGIEKIRQPIKEMPDDDQEKAMKYIQNLSKLCNLYYLNRN